MLQFLVKRFIGLIFVILCVTFITFIMGYFAPGDPIKTLLGNHFNPLIYARLRHAYGLDLPIHQQYLNYLNNLIHFDFGLSYYFQGQPVWSIMKQSVPISVELGFWGLLITIFIGIPLGILSAVKANTWIDTTNVGLSLVLYAVPTFIMAVLVQVIIVWLHKTVGLQWPVSGWGNNWQYSWSDIQYKLAPIVVFSAAAFAAFVRLARTSMLEILGQDFVRTARAKGLREKTVIYRHALRNALIPVITYFGVSLGFLLTGVFFIEQIFNIPGIGSTTITAIQDRDYPLIQATVILAALSVVVGNLIADLLYTVADPRIKSA